MLPGFRFLFAAIVLSMSILVFGLGAAALLRAAHEQFASIPSRRAPPEPVFARASEPTAPVLAALRVDAPVAEKASDDVASANAPAEQAAIDPAPAAPETTAAPKPEDSPQPENAMPETPVAETPPPDDSSPAQANAPPPAAETNIASAETALPPANEAAPAAPESASAAPSPESGLASTKIATLGGPPVVIETPPPAKATDAKPDRSAIKKRLRAQRARERRRIAAHAGLARPVPQQPAADPFAQPTIDTRGR